MNPLEAITSQVNETLETTFGLIPEPVEHNWYEAKQEDRRDRLQSAAQSALERADDRNRQANQISQRFAFGQPILVGHHSEGKARRDRDQMWANMDRQREELAKANDLGDRADAVGKGGISSDDPDAIRKLLLKLRSLMIEQEAMKAINKIVKSKKKTTPQKIEEALQYGIPQSNAEVLVTPDRSGNLGFASWELTNNNGNIKRIQQRIRQLQADANREPKTYELAGGFIVCEERPEENRIILRFPGGKPKQEIIDLVSRRGFHWSRHEQVWKRKLNGNAIYAVQAIGEQVKRIIEQ
jgi:hypothetical protein